MKEHANKAPAGEVANDALEMSKAVQTLLTVVPAQPQAVAEPRRSAVLWVYRGCDGTWCVREEGGKFEAAFGSHERAAACARAAGRAAGSYHLFLQLKDGRVIEERFNAGGHRKPRTERFRLPFIH